MKPFKPLWTDCKLSCMKKFRVNVMSADYLQSCKYHSCIPATAQRPQNQTRSDLISCMWDCHGSMSCPAGSLALTLF